MTGAEGLAGFCSPMSALLKITIGGKPMEAHHHFSLPGGVGEELRYGCHNCKHWDRITDTCPMWPEEHWHKGPVSRNLAGCQCWTCAYCGGPWWWLMTDHDVCQTLLIGVAA